MNKLCNIWGFCFDCNHFYYKKRKITGLMCSVKVNHNTINSYSTGPIGIKLTKNIGFTILLNSNAKKYIVQPHKIYFLTQCDDLIEEPLEIDNKTLMKYSKHFINAVNYSAEAEWSLNED